MGFNPCEMIKKNNKSGHKNSKILKNIIMSVILIKTTIQGKQYLTKYISKTNISLQI